MDKPTYYPEWAIEDATLPNTGLINKRRPKESLRSIGWDKGQIPTAEEWNWQFANISEWLQRLDTITTTAVDIGDANAYVTNLIPSRTEREDFQVIRFKPLHPNTGTSTINDGLGVVPLIGAAHSNLQGGELVAGGDAWVQWNPTIGGGSYILLFCSGAALQISDASKSKHAVTLGQASGLAYQGQFHKLTAAAGGTDYTVSASAETVVVADSNYNCIGLRNVSVSVNGANSGTNGLDTGTIADANWYYLHVIYNQTTQTYAGLLSLSATAPTLPSGYTHSAMISAAYVDAATTVFRAYTQINKDVIYSTSVTVLSAGSATTFTVFSTAIANPPSSRPYTRGSLTNASSTSSRIAIAFASSTDSVFNTIMSNGVISAGTIILSPIITQSLYYLVYSASFRGSVAVTGFELNI